MELDFHFNPAKVEVLIEFIKFKNFTVPKIEKSLRSFIEKYSPEKAFVVNKNLTQQTIYQKTKISFIPFWRIKEIVKNIV